MTTPESTPADTTPDDPQVDNAAAEDPTGSTVDETPEDPKPEGNREAKFRKQLRKTEAERDALAQRLTAMQRAEAQRLASDRLGDAADLWTAGTELDSLLADDGSVSPELVATAVDAVLGSHPHWAKTKPPAAPPAEWVTASGKIGAGSEQPSWTDLLQGRVNG